MSFRRAIAIRVTRFWVSAGGRHRQRAWLRYALKAGPRDLTLALRFVSQDDVGAAGELYSEHLLLLSPEAKSVLNLGWTPPGQPYTTWKLRAKAYCRVEDDTPV